MGERLSYPSRDKTSGSLSDSLSALPYCGESGQTRYFCCSFYPVAGSSPPTQDPFRLAAQQSQFRVLVDSHLPAENRII
jgi:hypothetical protein